MDNEIGFRIKSIRLSDQIGLNQTDFGKRIGVKQTTIAGYENGTRKPLQTVLNSICDNFGVNRDYLMCGIGEMFMEGIDEDETAALVSNLLGSDNPFYNSILSTMRIYDKLNENSRLVVDDFFKSIAEDMSNKKES